MAETYELVPAKPYRKLKRELSAIKEQAGSKALVGELLRSNIRGQEQLTGLITDLKKALLDFNKAVAQEKRIGVKQLNNKLNEVAKQNSELIGHVNELTKVLKKTLQEKKPETRPEFKLMEPPPTPSTPSRPSIPITYKRTKEVTK
jgi:hypothetical protein